MSSYSSQVESWVVFAGADDMMLTVISRDSHSCPRTLVDPPGGGLGPDELRIAAVGKTARVASHEFALTRGVGVLGTVGVAIQFGFLWALISIGSVLFVFARFALAFTFAILAFLVGGLGSLGSLGSF
jgi:hypothetical protein